MINPEVRDIITAELQPGEELLWAEKVDHVDRQKWIKRRVSGDRIRFFIGALMTTTCFLLSIPVLLTGTYETTEVILFLGGFFFLWSSWLSLQAFIDPESYNDDLPFHGYGLSNKRLIYCLTSSDSTCVEIDKIKAVSIDGERRWNLKFRPLSLQLWPRGKGLFTHYNLYFLPDFKKAKTEINSLIEGLKP